MELFEARDHYIIQNGEHGLWCNRFDGSLVAKRGEDICSAWNPVCLGNIYGVIGKMKIHPDSEWKLLLIRKQSQVGCLPGGLPIFRIDKIAVLPLNLDETKELDIDRCGKCHFGISKTKPVVRQAGGEQKSLAKTWSSIKSAAENVKPKKKEVKEKEKFERRILEELMKMFNDSNSFYYCPVGDLTNSVQRLNTEPKSNYPDQSEDEEASCDGNKSGDQSAWQKADDRFFWNKPMLMDLINAKDPLADPWIIPIIQGYVQMETCTLDFGEEYGSSQSIRSDKQQDEERILPFNGVQFTISLISRRSRFRAGTRYKRRGVDESGCVANYVETEQILEFSNHVVSFVQVRGSVPLYWSQTGIKYKPPPRIEKDDNENQAAFIRHFEDQIRRYNRVTAINVVDHSGKEKVIADAFLKHILLYNSPRLMYVAFDFHEYCRGMRFENVSILTESILDVIKDMRYCWVDQNGLICDQRGVFRVNCLDCLDRTNVVQSAIARIVLEIQCRKLGLLAPDEPLPHDIRLLYQQIWANTGDVISRQYAGTAALKGDYTRTGERRFSGLMKDGMNSASRYYINRVKDVYRQAAIDLMLGNPITEYFATLTNAKQYAPEEEDEAVLVEKEENMKTLIDECKKMLIIEPEACLGGWGLIDCDPVTGDPTQQDMDVILLLSQQAYYVARYDDEADQIISYQKVALSDLERIEIGSTPALFKSKRICIRLFYSHQGESGYFHTFCTTNTRLFNNIVITIKNEEESKESLQAICESFSAAKKLTCDEDLVVEAVKLDRKRSKPPPDLVDIASKAQLQLEAEGATLRSKRLTVPPSDRGTKINMSNISKTISGLNPVKKMKLTRLRRKVPFMPAVWYTKAEDADRDGLDQEPVERARILKGDRIVSKPFAEVAGGEEAVLELSSPRLPAAAAAAADIDVDSDSSSDYQVAAPDGDQHVVLASCGLLCVGGDRVWQTLAEGLGHVPGWPPVDSQREAAKASEAALLGKYREILQKRALSDLTQKHRSMSVDVSDHREMKRSWKRRSPVGDPDHHDVIALAGEPDVGTSTDPTSAANVNGAANPDECDVFTSETGAKPVAASASGHGDVVGDDRDTWVSVNITSNRGQQRSEQAQGQSKDSGAQLFHPCMKMSFSEGSLAATYHADVEQMTVDLDELEMDGIAHASPLTRLKVRMPVITLPNMPSPQSHQRQAQRVARHNRLKSQLRFQECQTKIILL